MNSKASPSEQLAKTLQQLGYYALEPSSLEWVFDYQETRPLLSFISNKLTWQNVLSQEDMAEYLDLQVQQKTLQVSNRSCAPLLFLHF